MKFILILLTNALALGAAVWLFDGITLSEADGEVMVAVRLIVVGGIFGLANAFVRPLVNLLALPLIILSLGLMLILTNALMLMLTSELSVEFDLGFRVDEFWWTAVWGAVVISLTTMVIEGILPNRK